MEKPVEKKSISRETRKIETEAEDLFLKIQNDIIPIIEELDSKKVDVTALINLKYDIDNLGTLLFRLLIKMHEEINENFETMLEVKSVLNKIKDEALGDEGNNVYILADELLSKLK